MSIRKLWPYALALLPWFAYVLNVFLAPRTGTVRIYGLDPQQIFYLRLTVLPFYLFNWLIGCFCVMASFLTARQVPEKKRAFRLIGTGVLFFLIGSMLGTNLAALRSHFLPDPQAYARLTILMNLVFAFTILIGMCFLYFGNGRLAEKGPVKIWIGWKVAGYSVLAALALSLVVFVLTNPDRQITYRMPDIAIATLNVAPYLAAFTLAILSAFRGAKYFLNAGGGIHKAAAGRFISGILLLTLGIFMLQAVLSMGPTRSAIVGLFASFGLSYAYVITYSAGYFLLGIGIRRITAIEHTRHEYYRERTPEEERDEFESSVEILERP
jgi:hypothetical protein